MSQIDEQATSPGRPSGRTWGGRRAGAGRKPGGRFAPLRGYLEYARNLVSTIMRDESQPTALRARCARAVLMKGSWVKYITDVPSMAGANPGGPDGAQNFAPPISEGAVTTPVHS